MSFLDRLRRLDKQVLPGPRQEGEPAEEFLRRVAAGRTITPPQIPDVLASLRELLAETEARIENNEGEAAVDEEPPQQEAKDESNDDESNDDESKDDESKDAESKDAEREDDESNNDEREKSNESEDSDSADENKEDDEKKD